MRPSRATWPWLLVLLLATWQSGCSWIWPEDGAYDPFRCDPECQGGAVCRSGRCVSLLDGRTDAAGDFIARPNDLDGQADDGPQGEGKKCGNGRVDRPSEECDTNVPVTRTCDTSTFTGGEVSCTDACTFSYDGCYKLTPPKGYALTSLPGDNSDPAVASDGTNFLLVWSNKPSSGRAAVYGRVIDAKGVALGSGPTRLCTRAIHQTNPVVAYFKAAGTYAVVWEEGNGTSVTDLGLTEVKQDGTLVDKTCSATIPGRVGARSAPAIAGDNTNVLVTWSERMSVKNTNDIRGLLVKNKVNPVGPFALVSAAGIQTNPAVVFYGTQYLVVWEDHVTRVGRLTRDIQAARVSRAGKLSDTTPRSLAASTSLDQSTPALTSDGINALMVWHEKAPGGTTSDIRAALISPAGLLLHSVLLASAAHPSPGPAALFATSRYLAVWGNDPTKSLKPGLKAARLNRNGDRLTDVPMNISAQFPSGDQESAALAHNGTSTLLAWHTVSTSTQITYVIIK